jgi:hypothetical protein
LGKSATESSDESSRKQWSICRLAVKRKGSTHPKMNIHISPQEELDPNQNISNPPSISNKSRLTNVQRNEASITVPYLNQRHLLALAVFTTFT